MKHKEIIDFFYELGMLRRKKHEGMRIIGIETPESIADHGLRAAQIAYFLSKLSGYKNPEEVVTITIFHDIAECRIGDLDKVNVRYVTSDEEKAVKDQLAPLKETGEEIYKLWKQVEYKDTEAGRLAKDADYLEQALTAKEYMEKGFQHAENWIDNVSKVLRTDKAKELLADIRKSDSNSWWQGLKKIEDISKDKK